MSKILQYIKCSDKYKYVSIYKVNDGIFYRALFVRTYKYGQYSGSKLYDTEREAALAVDKYLLSIGRNPVNILKKKVILLTK